MAIARPAPSIPLLGPDNTIDLVELGDMNLETFINYLGIAVGDAFWPNWRGCSAQGEAFDYFDDLVRIDPGELELEGMPVKIQNSHLKALKGGWVFYSYQMDDPSASDNRGEESLRLFFYVGKRPGSTLLLPVPQVMESHDLNVDLSLIVGNYLTVVTLPYRAMSVDDKVTLTIDRVFEEDDEPDSYEHTKTLKPEDIGNPIQWSVERNELEFFEGGYATLSYSIDYANPTESSPSHEQAMRILKATTPFLPAPVFKDEDEGDMLDPEKYRNGLPLTIPLYPALQLGDDVVLYANGDTRMVKSVRVDQSTIASKKLDITLGYEWLSANIGKEVSVIYQYARVGSAETSSPLKLTIRKPLDLPHPIIEKVISEGEEHEYKGYLPGLETTRGVYVELPDGATIGDDDKVQMVWDGHAHGGKYIADSMMGNPKKFQIPKRYIPANLGKRLEVFYQVTLSGETLPYNSKRFNLGINDIKEGWPTIQITSPPGSDNRLSLSTVIDDCVTFELVPWMFMAQDQRIRMTVKGVSQSDAESKFDLRTGDVERVTEDEYSAGKVIAKLPLTYLEGLKLNYEFDVQVEASFDNGFSYKGFPSIYTQLVE